MFNDVPIVPVISRVLPPTMKHQRGMVAIVVPDVQMISSSEE